MTSPRPSQGRGCFSRALPLLLAAGAATVAMTVAVPAGAQPPSAAGSGGPPQYLPITAQLCLDDGRCLQLEVPRTPIQYAWGLQQRPPLPPGRGMWFSFEPAGVARFWMHRTPAPLDLIFVREGQVLAIDAAAAPCPRLPCRHYGPEEPVDGVLEIGSGQAAVLGLRVGSRVQLRPLNAAAR